jgi:transposase-like protein
MAKKGYTSEQIINKLREAEISLSQGEAIAVISKKLGVSAHTYYRWRKEYNQIRPHSSPGYRPPAPEAIMQNILT